VILNCKQENGLILKEFLIDAYSVIFIKIIDLKSWYNNITHHFAKFSSIRRSIGKLTVEELRDVNGYLQ